jgi:hypothetical protein
MARSVISICNLALQKLGAKRIVSFGDATKTAHLCEGFYGQAVDEVLRMHPWNCAICRKELATEKEAPAFGWTYQYVLPSSPYCLRVLQMVPQDYEFVIEGRMLLTNEGTCQILYVKRVVDPNEFDALLVEAIVARLATKLAYSVTQSVSLEDKMCKNFKTVLSEARSVDAQEGTPQAIDTSYLLDSRY